MSRRCCLMALMPVLLSCGGGSESGKSTGPTPAPTPVLSGLSVALNPSSISVNDTSTASAAGIDQNGHPIATGVVTWSTASVSVATVTSAGTVTGVSPGQTTVVATAGGNTAQQMITVTPAAVASVSISAPSALISMGSGVQMTATIKDSRGTALTGRTVSWSSSNTAVATVSSAGLVLSVSPGTTTVSVIAEGITARADVTVKPIALDFTRTVSGTPTTLSPTLQSLNVATRTAVVSGGDSRAPTTPFTFAWGDGTVTTGFLPQSHVYADASHNFTVRVTAHYGATETDSAEVLARFVAPLVTAVAYPPSVAVTIPATAPTFTSRQPGYLPSANLRPLDDSFFPPTQPRGMVEYVLSQSARVQASILENDIERVNGEWRQVVLQDPTFGGAYSIWYTTPIAFGANPAFFQGAPGYSSLLHEMAHNLSLNAPAAFRYGGRIDGSANAIFSEAVAQMFQHAVAYELVNNASSYGLPWDLAQEIAISARGSAAVIRSRFEDWVNQGSPFTTWNDPATSNDEALGPFMAVARQFILHAEEARSYVSPLTRAMRLLRTFNATLLGQYAPHSNSLAADTFRSTLLVAALSYGFQQDLRGEFRGLNFPIDDAAFQRLLASVP